MTIWVDGDALYVRAKHAYDEIIAARWLINEYNKVQHKEQHCG